MHPIGPTWNLPPSSAATAVALLGAFARVSFITAAGGVRRLLPAGCRLRVCRGLITYWRTFWTICARPRGQSKERCRLLGSDRSHLIWDLAYSILCIAVHTSIIAASPVFIEVRFDVGYRHDCVFSRGTSCPAIMAIAPMVQQDGSRGFRYTDCDIFDVLSVCVEGCLSGGPIESILVVTVGWMEGHLRHMVVRRPFGMGDKMERASGLRWFVFKGKKLDVDLVGVVVVLSQGQSSVSVTR